MHASQETPPPEGHGSSSLTPLPASVSRELSDSTESVPRMERTYQIYREARAARLLANVNNAPVPARGASAHPASPEGDASVADPVTPPPCITGKTQAPHGPDAKHSYRPSSQSSTKASGSSGEESLPGAPPPMQYTALFGLDDPPSPSASRRVTPEKPAFEDLPVGSPTLSHFYVGRSGGPHPEFNINPHDPYAPVSPKIYLARLPTGAGPNDTPPQKVIVRGDHFLHSAEHTYYSGMPGYSPPSPIKPHLFDVGFAARASQPPDKYADEYSDEAENHITAADLSNPIFFGRRRPNRAAPGHSEDGGPSARFPPLADPSPARPRSRPAQAPVSAERGHSAPPTPSEEPFPVIVPDAPDPIEDPERSPPSSPPPRHEHTAGGPELGASQESDTGRVRGDLSHRGVDKRRPMSIVPQEGPAGARRAPLRAASSALAPGTFAGAQAESDSPNTDDEFVMSDSPASGKMRLFEELDDGGAAFNLGNDDDEDDAPAPYKAKSTHKARPARVLSSESNADSDADDDDCDESAKRARRKDKGKRPQRSASAGPSHSSGGRPPVEVNQEIEQFAHRMQAEIVQLSQRVGISYETLLRKMGFSQQEVRDPNLSNVFKQVHKERLRAKGESE